MNNTDKAGKGQPIDQQVGPLAGEVEGKWKSDPNTKTIKTVEQVSEETMPEFLAQKKDDVKRTIFF